MRPSGKPKPPLRRTISKRLGWLCFGSLHGRARLYVWTSGVAVICDFVLSVRFVSQAISPFRLSFTRDLVLSLSCCPCG
jgi:hypothetical protein